MKPSYPIPSNMLHSAEEKVALRLMDRKVQSCDLTVSSGGRALLHGRDYYFRDGEIILDPNTIIPSGGNLYIQEYCDEKKEVLCTVHFIR